MVALRRPFNLGWSDLTNLISKSTILVTNKLRRVDRPPCRLPTAAFILLWRSLELDRYVQGVVKKNATPDRTAKARPARLLYGVKIQK